MWLYSRKFRSRSNMKATRRNEEIEKIFVNSIIQQLEVTFRTLCSAAFFLCQHIIIGVWRITLRICKTTANVCVAVARLTRIEAVTSVEIALVTRWIDDIQRTIHSTATAGDALRWYLSCIASTDGHATLRQRIVVTRASTIAKTRALLRRAATIADLGVTRAACFLKRWRHACFFTMPQERPLPARRLAYVFRIRLLVAVSCAKNFQIDRPLVVTAERRDFDATRHTFVDNIDNLNRRLVSQSSVAWEIQTNCGTSTVFRRWIQIAVCTNAEISIENRPWIIAILILSVREIGDVKLLTNFQEIEIEHQIEIEELSRYKLKNFHDRYEIENRIEPYMDTASLVENNRFAIAKS